MERAQRSLAKLGTLAFSSVLFGGAAGLMYAARSRLNVPEPATAPVSAPALTPKDIALRSFASVVLVSTQDLRGRSLSFGSGFVVRSGTVLTNFHVLKGAASGSVRLIGDKQAERIAGVVALDPARDLVLVSVPKLEAAPLPLGDANAVSIGDKVFVVSNPQDLEGTFSEGIVSGKRMLDDIRLLQITAPISGGSSGGPVLDSSAQVIGVATSSLKSGQNLNFAITTEYVARLIDHIGPAQELARFTRPERPVQPAKPVQTTKAEGFFQRLARMLHLR